MKSLFHTAKPATPVDSVEAPKHDFAGFHIFDKITASLPHAKNHSKSTSKIFKFFMITLSSIGAIFIIFNLVLMLLYPKNQAMPYAAISDLDVAGMTEQEIISKLDSLSRALELSVKTDKVEESINLEDLGVAIDSNKTAEATLAKRKQSFIPVVSLWESYKSEPIQPVFIIDDTKLDDVAGRLVDSLGRSAANAGIVINVDGSLEVVPATSGYNYTSDIIKSEIIGNLSFESQSVKLTPQNIEPEITTAKAQSLVDRYEGWMNSDFSIEANGVTDTPSREEKDSWVLVNSKPEEGELAVSIDNLALGSYIASFASNIDVQAVDTVVTAVDGIETGRTEGEEGQIINRDASANLIKDALNRGSSSVIKLPLISTNPEIVYNNSYSPTNAGLANLVNTWVKGQTADYGIVVQELGGQGRTASHQPNKLYVTASTYKMFLAYTILLEVDNGDMKLDDKSGYSDWTVAACIQEMIRNSTNYCAVALGEKIGWAKATSMVRAAGFTSTTLDNYSTTGSFGHKWSTARDEANFLIKLSSGSLLSKASTDILHGHMVSQVFKGAIPAGLPGGVVSADKVGFLDTYRHDVAIVYSPSGTYILAVMSQWGTEYSISTLSKEVYEYFN